MEEFTGQPENTGLAARKALRKKALAARLSTPAGEIERLSRAICDQLARRFPAPPAQEIGFCWPIRNEPDLRAVIGTWIAAGAGVSLPRSDPGSSRLSFHRWTPDSRMRAGPFDIPEPAAQQPVVPGCLLIPMLAFDSRGYRLGYGAGFFDRTLADWAPRPLLIGVAFEQGRTESIVPQAHDVPVDWIATELGIFKPELGISKPELGIFKPKPGISEPKPGDVSPDPGDSSPNLA